MVCFTGTKLRKAAWDQTSPDKGRRGAAKPRKVHRRRQGKTNFHEPECVRQQQEATGQAPAVKRRAMKATIHSSAAVIDSEGATGAKVVPSRPALQRMGPPMPVTTHENDPVDMPSGQSMVGFSQLSPPQPFVQRILACVELTKPN